MKTSAWVTLITHKNAGANVLSCGYTTYQEAKKELKRTIGSEDIKQIDDYTFYNTVREIKYELKLITIFEEE